MKAVQPATAVGIQEWEQVMDWIPVTDRLPPIGKTVLACSSLAVTRYVAYIGQDGKWHEAFGGMTVQHITHWMELPEMPKGSVVL